MQKYNNYSAQPNIFADFIDLSLFFFEISMRSKHSWHLLFVTTLLNQNDRNEVKGSHRYSSETIMLLVSIVAVT